MAALALALLLSVSVFADEVRGWLSIDRSSQHVPQTPCAADVLCSDDDCTQSFKTDAARLPYTVTVQPTTKDFTTQLTFKVHKGLSSTQKAQSPLHLALTGVLQAVQEGRSGMPAARLYLCAPGPGIR